MNAREEVERFDVASQVEQVSADRFLAHVPDGWQQGRGAFGGLAIGVAARAMESVERERALRALTAELPGPLMAGEAEIVVSSLRRGTGMTTLEAAIVQGGETRVRASGVFGRARIESGSIESGSVGRTIELSDWRSIEPLSREMPGPSFARHFEYRVTGPLPFSGGADAVVEGWTRPLAPLARWGPAEIVAMADAYWPTLYSITRAPRPMATVTYTLQILRAPEELDPSAPLFYRARLLGAHEGYVSELRELWTPEGELVALNPQTFVVIK